MKNIITNESVINNSVGTPSYNGCVVEGGRGGGILSSGLELASRFRMNLISHNKIDKVDKRE